MTPPASSPEIAELEARIAELRSRLPKHTPPPSMLIELDELEDALERAYAAARASHIPQTMSNDRLNPAAEG
jgi:hypothetical protein